MNVVEEIGHVVHPLLYTYGPHVNCSVRKNIILIATEFTFEQP